MTTSDLIHAYYSAFNRQDWPAMLALLDEEVAHDINQGGREVGKARFTAFLAVMDEHYAEQVVELVVMTNGEGNRASAEFVIEGVYKKAQAGLPPAGGQRYRVPVGAFFEVNAGLITRVTNYYNLREWIEAVQSA